MNVYIRLVIPAREYFAKMLLGTIAASRGHTVLLGDLPKLVGRFPPGLFHTNDLGERKALYLAKLAAAGFRTTAHDEEHGLNEASVAGTLRTRFHQSTLEHVASSFSWGEWDRSALKATFPEVPTRFVLSGSPRVDLWRRGSGLDRFTAARAERFRSDRRTILVVSNFGPQPTPAWISVGVTRGKELGMGLADRLQGLRESDGALRTMAEFVATIDDIAMRWPETRVVVRPHPTEVWGGLAELIEPRPNVIVTRSGTTSEWLRVSDVMVHSGSTTGFEAMVCGVPTIAYTPGGLNAAFHSNRFGKQVIDRNTLLDTVSLALNSSAETRRQWFPHEQSELLAERIHMPQNALASERIVDEWERIGHDAGLVDVGEPSARHLMSLRRPTTRIRPRIGRPEVRLQQVDSRGSEVAALSRDESVRFPPFDPRDVQDCADDMASALGLGRVHAERLRPRLIRLRSAPRG